jgi:hypothetical protein
MIDLLMIALMLASFAGMASYIRACDHITGLPR